jgi:hypothetical protein
MGLFADIWGTVKASFQIGIGGVKLNNSTGNLSVTTSDGTTASEITVSKANVTGDSIDLNSDAASSGADWKYTVQRPGSGMSAAVTLTLPTTDGSPNQLLKTDGSGNLDWVDAGGGTDALVHVDTTTIAYNTASPVALFNLPANAVVHEVEVILDTPFNGTSPNMSIGVSGTASKYMGTGDNNLKGTAKDRYMTHPGETANGSPESLIATLVPSTADTGSVRVLVHYSTPA